MRVRSALRGLARRAASLPGPAPTQFCGPGVGSFTTAVRVREAIGSEPESVHRRPVRGYIYLLIGTVSFAAGPALLVGLGDAMPTIDALFYRGLMVSAVLLMWVMVRRHATTPLRPTLALSATLVGALLFAPHAFLFYESAESIGTGTAVALIFTYPAVILIVDSVQRRRRPSRLSIGVCVGLIIGISLICMSPSALATGRTGVAMVLCAAALYAVYVLCMARLTVGVNPLELAAYVVAGSTLSIGIGAVAYGSLSVPASSTAWSAVAVNGAMLGTGLIAYYAGLARIGARVASTIDSTQPAIAAVIGVVMLGERLGLIAAGGVVLVVGCAVLGSIGPRLPHGVLRPTTNPIAASATSMSCE